MNKCQYIDTCPAATGWCNNTEPLPECLGMVLNHYNRMKNKKGVLVVKTEVFLKPDKLAIMQKKFIEQMNDGVVIIPDFCTAEYVPSDVTVEMEKCHELV